MRPKLIAIFTGWLMADPNCAFGPNRPAAGNLFSDRGGLRGLDKPGEGSDTLHSMQHAGSTRHARGRLCGNVPIRSLLCWPMPVPPHPAPPLLAPRYTSRGGGEEPTHLRQRAIPAVTGQQYPYHAAPQQ